VNVEIGPKRRVRRPPELLFKFGDYEISRPLTSTHLQHGDRLRTVGWRCEVLIKQPSVPPTVVDGCRIALACKQDQCVSRQQPINGRAGGTQWFRYRSVIVPYKRERLIADQTERCAGEGADQRATLQYFTASGRDPIGRDACKSGSRRSKRKLVPRLQVIIFRCKDDQQARTRTPPEKQ